ncbi:hypothetical protein [Kitasatospora phosalacinea]|uniref:Uncharacterized protein n=1 Tax=Kitasatospora phosalacinea TaxID=2065 RepID=A0A9W6UP25_9ACTN|nr:hypothetical protein [Kitasatospora phosalacinea]GLW54732.1 hypothetical protein Kpho01_27430 [Kitasatospora phosalacinea]
MEAVEIGAGRVWGPWPELLADRRPVLVVPLAPERLASAADGWGGAGEPPRLQEGWSAAFDGARLVVTRPDGTAWYDGPLAAARDWARAVRAHRTLLIVTGPFTAPFDLHPAAAAGRLSVLTVPARLVDAH